MVHTVKAAASPRSDGKVWIFLSWASLLLILAMMGILAALICSKSFDALWPNRIERVRMADGSEFLGFPWAGDVSPEGLARAQYKVGNRELHSGADFRWVFADGIAARTRFLADKAKRGELEPGDCAGGVFSVSYLGGYEVDNFIAIVNPGEAAILAIGKTEERVVVREGEVVVRPMVNLTLSCDHRSIDGALAARLMGDIKRFLENPETLGAGASS